MNTIKQKKMKVAILIFTLATSFSSVVVYAADDFGQNAGQWFLNQIWYIALAVVAFMCVKFAAKKMWVQFGGFLILGGLVVFFVKYPDKIMYIGQAVYRIVFGQS